MTTLVTGASGFLGSHVARQLVARGEDVRVMMRPSSTNRAIGDLSLEYVTGDLRDPAAVARAIAGAKRVFHVAADYRLWAKRRQDIYDSNVGGTKNLLDAAMRAGTHGGVEKIFCSAHVGIVNVLPALGPQAVIRGHMEDALGARDRARDCGGIAQVAGNVFEREITDGAIRA